MATGSIALCAAISIEEAGDVAPDWLHLLPAGEVRTNDGRGPYRVQDMTALMAASLPEGGKLVLDVNHATDLVAPKGGDAPAHAWIVELQSREDGLWGRPHWIDPAAAVWRRYRGVSPVIAYRKDGTITGVLRASLTNTPNLTGLKALHHEQESDMDLRNLLIEALGLGSDASDEAIVAAVKAAGKKDESATALQSVLDPIAAAVGLAAGADATAILAGVAELKGGANDDRVVALQHQVTSLTTTIGNMAADSSRSAAVAFVDRAIADQRVGVKPLRDDYIAMHMANPEQTEKVVSMLPKVAGNGLAIEAAPTKPGELGAADRTVIALMGLDPESYKKTLAGNGAGVEAL